jgi:hypothetical protein
MKSALNLALMLLLSFALRAQVPSADSLRRAAAFAAFEPLLNRSWQADEQWENGQHFKQIVHFRSALSGQIIRVETMGFTDPKQQRWGTRNHGIRRWNPELGQMEFYEFDVLGGLTTGHLSFQGDSIFYHYAYGGNALTDAWLPVDANTYLFLVGQWENNAWTNIFLQTQFRAIMPTPDFSDATPLPYREIPPAPDTYNACTVAARMIDGLGFRYYWATEGLRPADLEYRPSPEGRTLAETISHIDDLAEVVHHAVAQQTVLRGVERAPKTFAEQRASTLLRLKAASDILRSSHPQQMEDFKLLFQRGERRSEYPFWNNLNGPLADAMWHVGQVVLLRRAAGNPFNSKVSLFQGKLRE